MCILQTILAVICFQKSSIADRQTNRPTLLPVELLSQLKCNFREQGRALTYTDHWGRNISLFVRFIILMDWTFLCEQYVECTPSQKRCSNDGTVSQNFSFLWVLYSWVVFHLLIIIIHKYVLYCNTPNKKVPNIFTF